MYLNSNINLLIEEARDIAAEDRAFLKPSLCILEEYIAEKQAVIYSYRKINNETELSLDDYSYEVYTERVNPFMTELVAKLKVATESLNISYTTALRNYEMVLFVGGVAVARVYNNMFPGVTPLIKDVFDTVEVPARFSKQKLRCFSPAVHAIALLGDLYNPKNADDWQEIWDNRIMPIMRAEPTIVLGGADEPRFESRRQAIARRVKQVLAKELIFIGTATTKVQGFAVNGKESLEAALFAGVKIFDNEEIIFRDQHPRIPQDFRLIRTTYYIANKRSDDKFAILDVFNTNNYALIPTRKAGKLYAGDVVRLRFRLIDVLTTRALGLEESRRETIEAALYAKINRYIARISANSILSQQPVESYIGQYYETAIYQKQTHIADMDKYKK